MIERYIPSRRRATLVAFLLDLEERLTDSALEMADKLIGGIFTRAKNAQARSYAATSKNVARLMLIFRRTIDALTDAVDTGEDPMEVLDASVGWHTLLKARPEVATIAETANLDPLRVAADRYATLRKFAPDLLEALQFRAGKGSAKTIAAIEMLRDLNRSGKRDLPADAPMPFRKEWQKIVMGDDGKINRRLWEIATIAHLRNKLRSGDVWVERSTGYRQFDSYLLSEPKAKPIVSALGLPPTAGEWLEQRGRELDWRLKKFARSLKRDALEGVRYRDGRLQISPVRTIATPDAEALADRLDAMMPRIRITELLHEVAQETGFLSAFTNLRTGELCPMKMRCSPRSSPTPPISACRAWPPRARASRAINSCGPMTPISATTATARRWPSSSTRTTACHSRGYGATAQRPVPMASSSGARSAAHRAATSTPAMASIMASASTPMFPISAGPTTSM
jgi:hypothetical protein